MHGAPAHFNLIYFWLVRSVCASFELPTRTKTAASEMSSKTQSEPLLIISQRCEGLPDWLALHAGRGQPCHL